MTYRKANTIAEPSHIDNLNFKSKASDRKVWEPKEDRIKSKEKTEEVGRNKNLLINGVDFHRN